MLGTACWVVSLGECVLGRVCVCLSVCVRACVRACVRDLITQSHFMQYLGHPVMSVCLLRKRNEDRSKCSIKCFGSSAQSIS